MFRPDGIKNIMLFEISQKFHNEAKDEVSHEDEI